MRVHHLNCGTFAPWGRSLVNGTGHLWQTGRVVCHCLLIETDTSLVLVDTGIGLPGIAAPRKELGWPFVLGVRPRLDPAETAVRQVVALGYAPSDVRDIVLTHLDVDHTGGLPDFPNAKVHVHAAELSTAQAPATFMQRQRYRTRTWKHQPDWVTHEDRGESWFGFDAVRHLPGLPEELLLIPLRGHTVGLTGVAVDTGRTNQPRWLLHASDAHYNHGQLAATPTCPPAMMAFQLLMQTDRTARLNNLQRLRELATNPDVDIICAHDPADFDRTSAQSPHSRPATGNSYLRNVP